MKLIRWLDDNLEEYLLIILLCSMTIIMGIQVCSRYVFNASLSWSEELTRYLFIWSAFISIAYCIKKWISIKIDQIINMLPKHVYIVFQLILNIILCVFFLYLSVHAFSYLQMSIASAQKSPALGLPMYVVQVAPLVGFSLASLRSFQQIVLECKNIVHYIQHKDVTIEKGGKL
ncbi:TRAP transporter small permease [Amedibacillus sp. YH-ame10]